MKKVSAKNGKKQVRAGKAARREGLLPPPVGTSDWATFSRDSYCVDKTLILKDLIDSKSRVVLFTRPRRFGKTTTLEMIRAFYEGEASLFCDKKIWSAGSPTSPRMAKSATSSSSAWPSTRRIWSSARNCPNDTSSDMRFRED